MGFLVEDLITSTKYRSFAPISQSTFQPSDVITIADEMLLTKMVSDLLSIREDFFLTTKNVPIVTGYDHYPVPHRSISGAFNALWFIDTGGIYYPLERIDANEKHKWTNTTGNPTRFYIEGDEVVIVPMPSGGVVGNLHFEIFGKPNRLVPTTSCAKITNINSSLGTTTFTVDTDLTASLIVGSKVDFLSSKSPFLLWFDTVSVTAITSTTIAVATSDVTNTGGVIEPQILDYICPNGYANIPMIPEEFHPVLAQMTACQLLHGLGDLNKLNAAKGELAEMRKEVLKLVKNRVESSPKRVANRNGLVKAFSK